MSNKITITIPTSSGEQSFYFGKKSTAAVLSVLFGAPLLLILSINNHKASREEAALSAELSAIEIDQASQFIQDMSSQILALENSNHLLNQELSEKNSQLALLGKRVFDVESVLGISESEGELETIPLAERVDAAAVNSAVRATMFRLIPNDSPMDYLRVSSSFGSRLNPITGKRHSHTGIDLTCKRGEAIYAPADGVIETVRPSKKGFGNFLIMRHSFGFMTSYAHLKEFKVKSGQFISKGETIATCGNSGNSTGPHLHYEVRFLGRALDPQHLMDWSPEKFNSLFEKENKVNWAPLVSLIDNVVRLQITLTNQPYSTDTVETARTDEIDDSPVN